MSVKAPQPPRRAESAWGFLLPPAGERQETARTVARGQGRREQRKSTTREARVGDSAWPGLAQVGALGRDVLSQKTGQERVEMVYGVTSRSPERATPERVLAWGRGQWQMAHTSHGVRDVTCDADRSQVRGGNMPHVMAA